MADEDPDITTVDRRPIAFAAIQDWERLLSQSDEAGVRAALVAAHQDRFVGWLLPNVDQELQGADRKRKRYPFRPDDILPWWTRFDGGRDDDDDENEAA